MLGNNVWEYVFAARGLFSPDYFLHFVSGIPTFAGRQPHIRVTDISVQGAGT